MARNLIASPAKPVKSGKGGMKMKPVKMGK